MLERARSNWTTASSLADAIVRIGGFSSRSAHGIVGRLVREAGEAGLGPDDIQPALLDKVALDIGGRAAGLSADQIREALDPSSFVATRVTAGSVNPDETRAMIAEGEAQWRADSDWLEAQRTRIAEARARLSAEVARRLQAA